ncbi:hypothetical protein Esti_005261 [Eimeria stiedai]
MRHRSDGLENFQQHFIFAIAALSIFLSPSFSFNFLRENNAVFFLSKSSSLFLKGRTAAPPPPAFANTPAAYTTAGCFPSRRRSSGPLRWFLSSALSSKNIADGSQCLKAASDGFSSFTKDLPDTALPPTTSNPPLVDLNLCREDFASLINYQPSEKASAPASPPAAAPAAAAAAAAAAAGDGGGIDGGGSTWGRVEGSDVWRVVPSEGPLGYFDERREMHPSLTGASGDAFFIDFYGPLQLSSVEVAASALSAAKRFVRTLELRGVRRARSQNTGHVATGPVVKSVDIRNLLKQDRFQKPPHWLVQRVAYSLQRLRPTSFGFLVAQMLEALIQIAHAEERAACTLDDFVSRRMQTYLRRIKLMDSNAHALHLTRGGPRCFNDVLKFKRGFPVFPWGLSSNPQTTRCFMKQLNVDEKTLTQHFFAARRGSSWLSAALYRIPEDEVPLTDVTRQLYEGFNSAAIACIQHIAAGWKRPVYILSDLERAGTIRHLLKSMGIVCPEAFKRIHIFGNDGFLMGSDEEDQRPRGAPPGVVCGGDPINTYIYPIFISIYFFFDFFVHVCLQGKSSSRRIEAALLFWEYHQKLGLQGVPHFIDDDIEALETAAADSRLHRWRLYFCDWGFSTFSEKLRALIFSSLHDMTSLFVCMIKVLPTMSRLSDLLLTPSILPFRLWALGSTSAPGEWLEEGRMARWLRLSGNIQPAG